MKSSRCRQPGPRPQHEPRKSSYNNADFWKSNGPVHVPRALGVVLDELRETLMLSYLLMRLGWPGFRATDAVRDLLADPRLLAPSKRLTRRQPVTEAL